MCMGVEVSQRVQGNVPDSRMQGPWQCLAQSSPNSSGRAIYTNFQVLLLPEHPTRAPIKSIYSSVKNPTVLVSVLPALLLWK